MSNKYLNIYVCLVLHVHVYTCILCTCVYTGEALNIDPREFYVRLYEALLQLNCGEATLVLYCSMALCTFTWFN